MLLFGATSSSTFIMSDVRSIYNPSSIRDWYLQVKFWTTDRQYSFCLWISWTRITGILVRSTWMNRVMHNTCIKHGRDIRMQCIGSTSILLKRKDWSSISLDRMLSFFTKQSSLLYPESCSDGNWRNHTRKAFCVTRLPPKISLKHDWKRELGSEHAQRPDGQVVQQFTSSHSSQAWTPWIRIIKVQQSLIWPNHALHLNKVERAPRYNVLGRYTACSTKRIEVLSNKIERSHPPRHTPSLLYLEKHLSWNLKKSYTRNRMCISQLDHRRRFPIKIIGCVIWLLMLQEALNQEKRDNVTDPTSAWRPVRGHESTERCENDQTSTVRPVLVDQEEESMVLETSRIHGRVSREFTLLGREKSSWWICVGRGEINEKTAYIQARPELWTKLGRNAQLKEREKWLHEKNRTR